MNRAFLIVVLVLAFASMSSSKKKEACTFLYVIQPWQNPELSQCSPINTTVIVTCSVRGSDSGFGITWHRTSNADHIGQPLRNELLINHESRYTVSTSREDDDHLKTSKLTIADFMNGDYGYYLCMVTSKGSTLPTPSHVLLINEASTGSNTPCSSDLELFRNTSDDCREDCADRGPAETCTQDPNCTTTTVVRPDSITISITATTTISITATMALISTSPYTSRVPQTTITPTKRVSSSSSSEGEGIEQFTGLILGLVAAVLLLVIVILFSLIVFVECRRRRILLVKGTTTGSTTHIAQEEVESARVPGTSEERQQEAQDKTDTSRVHDYTEISNLTQERAKGVTSVYENVQETADESKRSDYYEDVLPNLSRSSVHGHQYERVLDNELPGYHRLQHQGSVHSRASRQSSGKLQLSRQSSNSDALEPASLAQISTLRPNTLGEGSHHRIDIYKTELESPEGEEEYHRLDRRTNTTVSTTHVPSTSPSPELLYDKTTYYPAVSKQGVPNDHDYSRLKPQVTATVQVDAVYNEQELPEVKLYESLYRGLSHDRESRELKLGSGSVGGQIETPEDPTETKQLKFESLYSPPSEVSGVSTKLKTENQQDTLEEGGEPETADSLVPTEETKSEEQLSSGDDKPSANDRLPGSKEETSQHGTQATGITSNYSHLEPHPASNKAVKSKTLPAASRGEDGYEEISEVIRPRTAMEQLTRSTDRSYSRLELAHSVHNYTPIIPDMRDTSSNYNVAIVSTPDMYRSEQGHVYHVLET